MNTTKTTNENLTIKEAMTVLRCGRTTMWKLTAKGDLRHIKLDRKVLIPRTELNKFLLERTK